MFFKKKKVNDWSEKEIFDLGEKMGIDKPVFIMVANKRDVRKIFKVKDFGEIITVTAMTLHHMLEETFEGDHESIVAARKMIALGMASHINAILLGTRGIKYKLNYELPEMPEGDETSKAIFEIAKTLLKQINKNEYGEDEPNSEETAKVAENDRADN